MYKEQNKDYFDRDFMGKHGEKIINLLELSSSFTLSHLTAEKKNLDKQVISELLNINKDYLTLATSLFLTLSNSLDYEEDDDILGIVVCDECQKSFDFIKEEINEDGNVQCPYCDADNFVAFEGMSCPFCDTELIIKEGKLVCPQCKKLFE